MLLDSGGGSSRGCCWDLEFARPAARQVPAPDELGIVDHPVRAKVVFVSNEAFVQRQIGTDGILLAGRKREVPEKRKTKRTSTNVFVFRPSFPYINNYVIIYLLHTIPRPLMFPSTSQMEQKLKISFPSFLEASCRKQQMDSCCPLFPQLGIFNGRTVI